MNSMLQMQQDRPRALQTGASRLNAGPKDGIATISNRGRDHASDTLSVLRWPLRGGDRVLQEGARRRGRDDDALQGNPEPQPPGRVPPGSEDKIMHACLRMAARMMAPTATPRAIRVRRLLAVIPRQGRNGGQPLFARSPTAARCRCRSARRSSAALRHGRRPVRGELDGDRGGLSTAKAIS